MRVREAGDAEESHKEGIFFFWWKGGSHCPIAKISFVAVGSGGEGETPSLMGKNSPGLPHPPTSAKYQRVYKINGILCFPAGHILPPAPDTGLNRAQKTWGGAAFSIFLQKTDENEWTAKK